MAPTCVEVVDKPLRVADISVLVMQSRRAAVPLRLVCLKKGIEVRARQFLGLILTNVLHVARINLGHAKMLETDVLRFMHRQQFLLTDCTAKSVRELLVHTSIRTPSLFVQRSSKSRLIGYSCFS